jgi:dTDP-4-dehydrorhamnose 3,5-epimerase
MDKINISGVILTPLIVIKHPLGDVYRGMKKSDEGFAGFGEVYFSTILPNTIKPWKKHVQMTLNLVVPVGEIRFVLYDEREESPTRGNFMDVTLSLNNYYRLTVPPHVWMAFQGVGKDINLLLNVSNILHDPNEIIRGELDQFEFRW